MGDAPRCDVIALYRFLGKKWTVELFHNLSMTPVAFTHLHTITERSMSPTLLSSRLKRMQEFGIITRRVAEGKNTYALSPRGVKLKRILHEVKDLAIECGYDIPEECKGKQCYCSIVFKGKAK